MSRVIALVGLRCSGKSTLGRLLASELGLPFVDLDEELGAIEGSGRPAGELLGALGEADFRELEERALGQCLARGAQVLATGGGVVESEVNREVLAQRARVVWLDAADEVLLARRVADPAARPLLAGRDAREELLVLRERRGPHYSALGGASIDTHSREAAVVARELAEGLRNEIGAGD